MKIDRGLIRGHKQPKTPSNVTDSFAYNRYHSIPDVRMSVGMACDVRSRDVSVRRVDNYVCVIKGPSHRPTVRGDVTQGSTQSPMNTDA